VIMVGPGTGIAPFRAFIEERGETAAKGETWLFFGDQRYTYDFLYQLELQDHLQSGALTKLDVAFSRDQPEKVYVQNKMQEQGEEIYKWLEAGAYFYVCGDAERMAKDVNTALIDIVAKHGGKSADDAAAYIDALKKDKRYQRDVY
jgi:sulfite reductase (NADPH) flavoprotein alpha-component